MCKIFDLRLYTFKFETYLSRYYSTIKLVKDSECILARHKNNLNYDFENRPISIGVFSFFYCN